MTDIHIGASGLPCVDASTGKVKLHSGDCCVDCDTCSGSGPVAYKAKFDAIESNDNCGSCSSYEISYVVPNTATGAICTWANTVGVPDACDVPSAGSAEVRIMASTAGSNHYVSVAYTWGVSGGSAIDIDFSENYGTNKPDCVSFNNEDIQRTGDTVSSYCDASAATCRLTAL